MPTDRDAKTPRKKSSNKTQKAVRGGGKKSNTEQRESKKTDRVAKTALKKWPRETSIWEPNAGKVWFRAQPKSKTIGPRIFSPGTNWNKTQPDGLWVKFSGLDFCDVVVVEACGTIQNFYDKRSRYQPSTGSLLLECKAKWFAEGSLDKKTKKKQWETIGLKAKPDQSNNVPIRSLVVLFALPVDIYKNAIKNINPANHEYFCTVESLGSFTGQGMQTLLRLMSPSVHYYTSAVKLASSIPKSKK